MLYMNFYLLCSYITDIGLNYVKYNFNKNKTLFQKCRLIINEKVIKPPLINNILTLKEIDVLNSFKYPKEYNDKYLIYFDHKLADKVSTITDIYSGYVLNNEIKNKIIPVINNCQNIINYDLGTPKCPFTPYKKTYDNYINEFKKNSLIKIKSLSIKRPVEKIKKRFNSSPIKKVPIPKEKLNLEPINIEPKKRKINFFEKLKSKMPTMDFLKKLKSKMPTIDFLKKIKSKMNFFKKKEITNSLNKKIEAIKKAKKALSPFINRVSVDIYRRNRYYIMMKRELKDKKIGCLKIYKKNSDGSYSYRIGNRIILKKRIGSNSIYGIVYLSEFREKEKKILTFASKVYEYNGYNTDKELKILNYLTNKVRMDLCPHFPMYYGNIICENYINKNEKDSFKKSVIDNKSESQLSKKFPKMINNNKSVKFITIFNELANGDLKYFFSIYGNDTKLLLNAFTQQIISILFYNYYTNEIHGDIHSGNFLYHKVKSGGYFHYKIFGVDYYLENLGYLWVIWDFDFSVNLFSALYNNTENDYYDLMKCYLSEKKSGYGYNKEPLIEKNIELYNYMKEFITLSNKYYNIKSVDKFKEYIFILPILLSSVLYNNKTILLKTLPYGEKIINKNSYTIIKEEFFKDNKNKIIF